MAAAAGAPPAAPHNPNGTNDGIASGSQFDASGRDITMSSSGKYPVLVTTKRGTIIYDLGDYVAKSFPSVEALKKEATQQAKVAAAGYAPQLIHEETIDGSPCLVMEKVTALKKVTPSQKEKFIQRVAGATGIVQRDETGDNVMFGTTVHNPVPQLYLIDYGITDEVMAGSGKKAKRKHRRLRGKGPFDFLDPAKNGLNESIRHTGEVLGNAFDPNKNGLAAAVNAASDKLKAVDWNAVKNKIGDGLDPKKNGVSAAFDKFGGDAKKAFEDLGNKIKESAQRDKAKLDQAFAPFVREFTNPDSALAKFVQSAGIPISADDWKKKFEDPDTYFTILSVLVTAAASVCSAGLAGPGVFAATQALIAGTKLLTKAAMGKPIDPMDIAGVVTSVVPGAGGGTATTWLKVATSAATKVGTSAVKEAAKNVIKSNKDGLIEMGQTLATMSNAAAPAPPPAQDTNKDVEDDDDGLPPAAADDAPAYDPHQYDGPAEGPKEEEEVDTRTPEQQASDAAAQAAESSRLQAAALAESQAAAQATEASGVGSVSLEPPPAPSAPAPPQVQVPAAPGSTLAATQAADLATANAPPPSQSQIDAAEAAFAAQDAADAEYLRTGIPPMSGGSMYSAQHPFFHIKARAARMGRTARLDTLDPFFFEGTVDGRLAGSGKRSRDELGSSSSSSSEADTEFEYDSESSSSGEELPPRFDYTKYFVRKRK